jgi:hypothetical protein
MAEVIKVQRDFPGKCATDEGSFGSKVGGGTHFRERVNFLPVDEKTTPPEIMPRNALSGNIVVDDGARFIEQIVSRVTCGHAHAKIEVVEIDRGKAADGLKYVASDGHVRTN